MARELYSVMGCHYFVAHMLRPSGQNFWPWCEVTFASALTFWP